MVSRLVFVVQDKTNERRARNAHVQIFPQPIGAFFGFSSDSFFFQSQIYKKRMTRPPRATKRYLSRTHKEERNTQREREREREIDAPLGHDARRRRLQLSFVHQSVAVSVLGKSSVSNLFQRHTRGKIRLQFFSFFFEKLLGGLDSVYVSPLSSSLRLVSSSTKEETSKGPPLLVGFFCANTKNDTAKERESSSRWLRCETKKVGVPFDESPLPFCLPFPRSPFSLH